MVKRALKLPFNATVPKTRNLHLTLREDRAGFELLAGRLRATVGVEMPPTLKNITLMACRMAPLLRRRGCESYADFHRILQAGEPQAHKEFIATLTTHTTDFFREAAHFEILAGLVKDQKLQGSVTSPLRVWCAAASTGQEPYTILMTLLGASGELGVPGSVKFLASDIDTLALLRGSRGRYTDKETVGVPPSMRRAHFVREGGGWRVKKSLRTAITFAPFNLSIPEYPFQFPFQLVFCRNVLIYFKRDAAAAIIEKMISALGQGGYLFLGHAETGFVRHHGLKTIAPAVYRKE